MNSKTLLLVYLLVCSALVVLAVIAVLLLRG